MAETALAIDYYKIDPTQIRVLTLHHGAGPDEVICTLIPPSNGDPNITVNGHKVQIRRNLFDALRSIRRPTEDQKLWVDAICINQSNVDEKREQVAMMGNTFTRAIGVITWLGPANDDSDLAMGLMSDADSLKASLPSFSKYSREGKALSSICYRTYWGRVWIIQELYLARSFVEQDFVYALLDISTDYEGAKETFKVDYSKTPREVFLELLWERGLSTWRNAGGDEKRWLGLAEKMNLNTDEDLKGQISARFSRRGS
ncbi:heterokaryon incompatibility 6 OR allele [Fusarium phyllophilum]|uniref:Heterokaryon incompatibility 6 OR allele n=1 Tax=Fusarium phyllophilum TaxID=47803 RepID=A0A8H5K693_9HYPO|nr:heterokaryon incompatibility 6 OR allele [Fusarium phyllophilum]